jgi:putative sporulation protein YyaC
MIKRDGFDSNDIDCVKKFANSIREYLKVYDDNINDALVIVNIGTDRATGDCLAPMIGQKLKDLKLKNVYVYGNLDNPVHAKNLDEILDIIHNKFKKPFIVAIDACLGRLESIGKITIKNESIKPGSGVNKELTPVGDVSIVGIVNVGGFMEIMILQNTRLSLVMKLVNIISEGLEIVLKEMFDIKEIEEIAVDKEQSIETFNIKEFLHKVTNKKVRVVFR